MREATRMMPALSNRAWTAVSLETRAPVWLAAARLPASVVPAFIPARVQPLAARLRAWANRRLGSFTVSMYRSLTGEEPGPWAWSKRPRRSVTPVWAELPTVRKELKASPRLVACSAR